jgi:class 3 adenylate cyclase
MTLAGVPLTRIVEHKLQAFRTDAYTLSFAKGGKFNPVSLQHWAGVEEWSPRTTLAVLFTDIIDSTKLARTLGDRAMFEMLNKHFEDARIKLMLYDAIEVKTLGDGYMAAFRTADDALQFALNFRAGTGDDRIATRVGVHVGPVRVSENDIDGLVVNYAARLSHVKVPGEEGVFLSNSAKENIEAEHGSTQKDFRFFAVSGANLKGFSTGERVWQVITTEIRNAQKKRIRKGCPKQNCERNAHYEPRAGSNNTRKTNTEPRSTPQSFLGRPSERVNGRTTQEVSATLTKQKVDKMVTSIVVPTGPSELLNRTWNAGNKI